MPSVHADMCTSVHNVCMQVGNKVLAVAAQDRPSGGGRRSQGGDSGPLQGEAVRSSRSSLSGSHTDLASAASLGGTFSAPIYIPGAVVGGQAEGEDLLHPEALFPQAHQVEKAGRHGLALCPASSALLTLLSCFLTLWLKIVILLPSPTASGSHCHVTSRGRGHPRHRRPAHCTARGAAS